MAARTPLLCTIGYEATTVAHVRTALTEAGVTLLVDVRAVASSRKPGFSKTLLASTLASAGIGYLHLRPLGTPKAGREAVRRGDVAAMERIFADHMRDGAAQAALAEAAARVAAVPTCLLCFERDHRTCHRTLVAELIADRTGQAIRNLVPELPS